MFHDSTIPDVIPSRTSLFVCLCTLSKKPSKRLSIIADDSKITGVSVLSNVANDVIPDVVFITNSPTVRPEKLASSPSLFWAISSETDQLGSITFLLAILFLSI